MPHHIKTNGTEMMKQAHETANEYLIYAIDDVEKHFGKGAAEKYPQIIAAYMQTAAIDFAGNIIAQQVRAGLDDNSISFEDRNEIIEALKSLNGLDAIATSIQNVAAMLDMYSCGKPSKIYIEKIED